MTAHRKVEHATSIHNDGFYFYFTCAAGDVTHTSNAYLTLELAELAAKEHEEDAARKALSS